MCIAVLSNAYTYWSECINIAVIVADNAIRAVTHSIAFCQALYAFADYLFNAVHHALCLAVKHVMTGHMFLWGM